MTNPDIQERRAIEAIRQDQACSDESLMRRFQAEGERHLFAELLQRNLACAFRVAFSKCGNHDLAEEAVQETFLRLAQCRTPFRDQGPGSFRRWLIGFICNLVRDLERKERRKEGRIQEFQARQGHPAAGEPEGGIALERGDQLAGLRAALQAMSEEFRQPIVLHYVEGLPQAEVGQILGLSQAEISRRIAQGLRLLRGRLTGFGLLVSPAALLERLSEERLLEVPPGLLQRLQQQPWETDRRTGGVGGLRWRIAKTSLALTVAACLLLAGAAGIGLSGAPQRFTERTPPDGLARQPPPQAAGDFEVVHLRWDFRQGPPRNLKLAAGDFRWVAHSGLVPTSSRSVILLLPCRRPALPLEFRAKFSFRGMNFASNGCYWSDGKGVPSNRMWPGHAQLPQGDIITSTHYLLSDSSYSIYGQDLIGTAEYDGDCSAMIPGFGFRSLTLHELEVRSIPPAQLPDSVRKGAAFKPQLGPSQRQERFLFD